MNKNKWGKWALGLGLVAAFVAIALLIEQLQVLDTKLSLAVAGRRTPFFTTAMKGVTQLASAPVLILLSAGLVYTIRKTRLKVPLIANLGISVILNLGLKALFTRPRPVEVPPLVIEAGFSFPSGHSMAAAAFYGFVIYLIRRSQMSRRAKALFSALCVGIIGLVGFSRVYLGVHYASDVVAGFLVSSLYLLVFTSFVSAYFDGDKSLEAQLDAASAPTLLMSFAHAGDGIIGGLKAERNMVIHFGMMTLVIVLASLLQVSLMEWCLLIILFGMVLAAELINTAIEAVVDLVTQDKHPLAKLAKDTAAGAVLITALIAAVVGLIILGPKLVWLIKTGL
ncbi:MAG: phosphatase PAP2 family protein [Clostridiales bacterium]|nr:phosphatase PAP2 family protein [Clostridiales bacterium]